MSDANHTADSPYEPPKQSAIGQFIDSLFLLVLVLVALFAPLYLGLAGGGKTELAVADKTTWIGLGQNAVQQAQWEKLGFTPDTAASIITSRFDYSFNTTELIITAIVVVGYFLLLFRFSKTEYRDVIFERFGKK
jgi:cell division protein FtsW (lipid II flippase)